MDWIHFWILLFMGQLLPPKMNAPPTLKNGVNSYQLSSGGGDLNLSITLGWIFPRHDPHLNGRPLACAGKVSTAAGRIYLSREASRWPSGASTCLNDLMETSEQQLQWGLARILVTEHDFMILTWPARCRMMWWFQFWRRGHADLNGRVLLTGFM